MYFFNAFSSVEHLNMRQLNSTLFVSILCKYSCLHVHVRINIFYICIYTYFIYTFMEANSMINKVKKNYRTRVSNNLPYITC